MSDDRRSLLRLVQRMERATRPPTKRAKLPPIKKGKLPTDEAYFAQFTLDRLGDPEDPARDPDVRELTVNVYIGRERGEYWAIAPYGADDAVRADAASPLEAALQAVTQWIAHHRGGA